MCFAIMLFQTGGRLYFPPSRFSDGRSASIYSRRVARIFSWGCVLGIENAKLLGGGPGACSPEKNF